MRLCMYVCIYMYIHFTARFTGTKGHILTQEAAETVTAALRALLLFHAVSLAELGLEEAALPKLAWQVEEEELGIRAGLMDRLVQHADGLLLMDFATTYLEAPYYSGRATRVRLELLPPLYLAYSLSSAGESGRVHAPVRRRFERERERVCVCVLCA